MTDVDVTGSAACSQCAWYAEDAIFPHANGYGCWFIAREDIETGTFPMTAERILDRIDARAALSVSLPEAEEQA